MWACIVLSPRLDAIICFTVINRHTVLAETPKLDIVARGDRHRLRCHVGEWENKRQSLRY